MRRAIFILLLAATACGGRRTAPVAEYKDAIPPPEEPLVRQVPTVGRYGGRFVLGQTVGPKSFNGIVATETSTTDLTNLMFTSLVDYDNGKQEFGPLLAKSWDVSPDGMTWTFHLRKGAAFSDGHPLTSEDVLFSFQVAMDPTVHPPIQDQLSMNGKPFEASAPDPFTFVLKTPAPNSGVLDAFCTGSFVIMPKHVLEASFKEGNFASVYNVSTPPDKLISSGPWRVVQYVPGEKAVLGRNPYWFGFDQEQHRLPYLNELTFLQVPDQDAADLKFRGGELSGLDNTKAENYKWYEDHQKEGNFTFYRLGPALTTNFSGST
jgi:peptide/nickel transport system substrate-binding protein